MAVASGDFTLDRVRASPRFAFHANDATLDDAIMQSLCLRG